MNFKELRAFKLVAEFGSITAAADKLRLSASSVSRLVSQLEAETKLKLFDRTRQGLIATEAGHLFLREAERLLADLDDLPEVIRRIDLQTSGRLNILTTPRLAPGLILPAVARMSEEWPEIKCTLDVQPKWELERSLRRSRFDVCAAILPVPISHFLVCPLYRIRSDLLVPNDHRLASYDRVTASDLRGERLIGFLPGQHLRRQIVDFFRNAGMEFDFCMEVSDSSMVVTLAKKKCGLSVADSLLCSGLDVEGLTRVPFYPHIWTTTGLLLSKGGPPTEPTIRLIDSLIEVLREFAKDAGNAQSIEVFAHKRSDVVRNAVSVKRSATTP